MYFHSISQKIVVLATLFLIAEFLCLTAIAFSSLYLSAIADIFLSHHWSTHDSIISSQSKFIDGRLISSQNRVVSSLFSLSISIHFFTNHHTWRFINVVSWKALLEAGL
jgi:hypothetical protein